MKRALALAFALAAAPVITGCEMLGMPASGGGTQAASATPGLAAQGTIVALQTWLMLQQGKAQEAASKPGISAAQAEKQRNRATAAGSIMNSLSSLRSEVNCQKRLALATAVSGGLQAEFPNYQGELSLGTNLVGILVSANPACQ